MENLKKIYVVSNKLSTFARHKNIFTVDNFLAKVRSKKDASTLSLNPYEVNLGQGLNDEEIDGIINLIVFLDLENLFILNSLSWSKKRSSKQLTHKHKDQNIIISEPKKLSCEEYQSDLMLNESCAEMSDHITGQHIQGMVLIEAARQMVNSVSEKFLIPKGDSIRKGFVLNGMNVKFNHYVLPLDVELNFVIRKLRRGLGGNFKVDSIVNVIQNSQLMMSIQIDFSVMDKVTLLNIESKIVEQSI